MDTQKFYEGKIESLEKRKKQKAQCTASFEPMTSLLLGGTLTTVLPPRPFLSKTLELLIFIVVLGLAYGPTGFVGSCFVLNGFALIRLTLSTK